mgnify:CR=1 FL=1
MVEKEDSEYEVEFVNETKNLEAKYDLSGKLLEIETKLASVSEIPSAIMT